MDILILATLALAAAMIYRLTRGSSAPALVQISETRTNEAPSAAPRRITSPRRAGRPDVSVWVLHACPQCELTHDLLNGHRYLTAEAPSLPGMGCDLANCDCRYQPVRNSRRGERRHSNDRRDAIRFQSNNERRRHSDRRESDGWRHANVQH